MPVTKRATKKSAVPDPSIPLTPSQTVAANILGKYSDLAPSVTLIMQSDLDEAGRLHAITLFQSSLGAVGDPMRVPGNAIEAGRLHVGVA